MSKSIITNIEGLLTHDGKNWIFRFDEYSVCAPTLEKLDAKICELIKNNPKYQNVKKVVMCFDIYTLPQWIRQYMQHYFDRILILEDPSF